MFLQVTRAFSAYIRPSRSRPNRDPNHANFVNWATYLRWRAQPLSPVPNQTRRRRAGAPYSKSCRVHTQHAGLKRTIAAFHRNIQHTSLFQPAVVDTTRHDTQHPRLGDMKPCQHQFFELATTPMPFSVSRRLRAPMAADASPSPRSGPDATR